MLGEYSSAINHLPSGRRCSASVSKPFGLNANAVRLSALRNGTSSRASLLMPLTALPERVVSGMYSSGLMLLPAIVKRTIAGVKLGSGKTLPSTAPLALR